MITVALYSIKGGVGKTSTAVNLAHLAAARGARVLLWDLDPQAATTWCLRVRPKIRGGSRHLLSKDGHLEDRILASDHPRLDLLPAALSLRKLERRLQEKEAIHDRLATRMAEVRDRYDLVVLDCPPGLTLLSENVFEAADVLLVPLIPSPLSVRTLEQLTAFLVPRRWAERRVVPFFSMVDGRKKLHREVVRSMRASIRGILPTPVPNATEIERMGVARAPVVDYAPRTGAARAYGALHRDLEHCLYVEPGSMPSARELAGSLSRRAEAGEA